MLLPRTAVLMRDVGIGDLVWHAPYFRQIAAHSADGQVTLFVPPSTQARDLVGHEPWVRDVMDFDRRPRRAERRRGDHGGLRGLLRLARQFAEPAHDRVVLFTRRPLPAAFACCLAGIPQRVGFGTRAQRWLLSRQSPIARYDGPGVASYWYATALCRLHGWCDGPLVPRLSVRPDALASVSQRLAGLPRPLRALAIGSSEACKQWGAERFAALAGLLAARGDGILLIGGPSERAMAETVLAALPARARSRVLALTDRTVADTVAAMTLADCCIGNDTGAANIAAAVGTPTWVVLGPRPLLEHDPERLHMIRGPRLDDITAEDVLAQVFAATRVATLAPRAEPVDEGAQPRVADLQQLE
jgi:heptosyltransferase-2